MSNPLFNQMNNNPMAGFMRELEQFKNNFRGNPRDKVQELLNSGQMTQQQFNELAQQTNEIMKLFK